MGSKHIKDFKEKFLEKGLTPLEEIIDAKHKVECRDSEGYKYLLSYRGAVSDKRTKHFNKWDKNNPFKPYNMRLYASRVQENVKILSTDEELREATTRKVKFVCPNCNKPYEKKWCHWIAQEDNQHFCPDCGDKLRANGNSRYAILTEQWLKEHNLNFYKEYKFPDCRDERELRFDFCVEWNNSIVLIEVDGIQHFYLSVWTTPEKLAKTKEHDLIKDEYCAKNGYTLVHIPYWLYRTETYKIILHKTFFG